MQSYKTSQVGSRASQVGGIAWIVKENERNLEPSGMAVINKGGRDTVLEGKYSYTVIILLESNASKCKAIRPAR